MTSTRRRLPLSLLAALMTWAPTVGGTLLSTPAQAKAGMSKAPNKVAKKILADLGNQGIPVRYGRFLLCRSDRTWGHFILKFPPVADCPSIRDGISVIRRIDGKWSYVSLSDTGDCPYFKR